MVNVLNLNGEEEEKRKIATELECDNCEKKGYKIEIN
jgi:hypothetical protein